MPYAHKLTTYRDDAFRNVTFCQVCGHDYDLAGPCSGEYVLSQKEQAHIDSCFNADMLKIFACHPVPNPDYKAIRDEVKQKYPKTLSRLAK